MPERDFKALTQADKSRLTDYESGYDWIPGRFGPPPGIPRERKRQLDHMTDRDFMAVVMRMGQEEKESLMISEAERLRTYKSLWPNPPFISYKDLAREGFYYTGMSDRVQCAFCAGFLGNWEAGDIPHQSHKNFFSYCKMAQRRPCANIPLSDDDGKETPSDLSLKILTTRQDSNNHLQQAASLSELGISNDKPHHPRYRIHSYRLSSYRNYSSSYPITPETLSEAGFFYEGPGDKVRCYWCDGALELWADGDDVWTEHAKWYPGCGYVQQIKGKQFIRQCRAQLSAEDLTTAEGLQYNNNGTQFLNEDDVSGNDSSADISMYDTYQVCQSIGFSREELEQAFSFTEQEDYSDVQSLLTVLLAVKAKDETKLKAAIQEEKASKSRCHTDIGEDNFQDESHESTEPRQFFDTEKFIKEAPEDPGGEEAKLFVAAMTCFKCCKEQIGAVLLPCGHFALCHKCSLGTLPERCFICHKVVRAACRTFLS